MPFRPPSEPVIRRAEAADLPGITWLRREWAAEQDGEIDDPGFDERFAAWLAPATHSSWRRTAIRASARSYSTPCSATRMRKLSPAWCPARVRCPFRCTGAPGSALPTSCCSGNLGRRRGRGPDDEKTGAVGPL